MLHSNNSFSRYYPRNRNRGELARHCALLVPWAGMGVMLAYLWEQGVGLVIERALGG